MPECNMTWGTHDEHHCKVLVKYRDNQFDKVAHPGKHVCRECGQQRVKAICLGCRDSDRIAVPHSCR